MKTASIDSKADRSKPAKAETKPARVGVIHPVVIFPFLAPTDYSDLVALYDHLVRWTQDETRFARPIVVLDRKTVQASAWNKEFTAFKSNTLARHSRLIEAWCVDTCQMWYTGLGAASDESGGPEDVFWLIPGDFNYGTPAGHQVLAQLERLPEAVVGNTADLVLGEIALDPNSSKLLIDTYGTFALLYHWFPHETQLIRKVVSQPRSEFFAISNLFLQEMLNQRWYAYEQTLVILLRAVATKRRVTCRSLGDISDRPSDRESLASALQQVERMERVLKMVWRDAHQQEPGWLEQFQARDPDSARIRAAALAILKAALR